MIQSHYEIIILGSGVSGLSTFYHLKKRGYKRIALIAPSRSSGSLSHGCPGGLTSSFSDHFTRYSHHYGKQAAKEAWQFARGAYDAAIEHLISRQIPFSQGTRWRVSGGAAEDRELKQAMIEMKDQGIEASLWETGVAANGRIRLKKGRSIMEEKAAAATIDVHSFLDSLSAEVEWICDEVIQIKEQMDGVVLRGRKHSYVGEMVVTCTHTASQDLLTLPPDTMIGYADQWAQFDVRWQDGILPLPVGSYVSFLQGYVTIIFDGPTTVSVIGGRHLRAMAGIGETKALYRQDIEDYQLTAFLNLFPTSSVGMLKKIKSAALLGARPCDDYPIIGPFFGSLRILMAGGFMGQGLAIGFYAGALLSQLIDQGQSPDLPRAFYPERFRSALST